MNNKKTGIASLAGLMALVVIGTTACNSFGNAQGVGDVQTQEDNRFSDIENKIDEIDAYLDKAYLYDESIDESEMEAAILKGYVDALNEPYTTYYTAEEYKSLMESTSGAYEGVGMVLGQTRDTKIITVMSVFENGPAAKAGLLPGDVIYKVNGEEVGTKELTLVVKDIKGEAGTEVTLTMYRQETDEYLDFTMKREHVEQPTVDYEMLENNIGYIEVSSFEQVTTEQFKKAIEDLEKGGMESLIVDLRNNPGGLLDTVCEMLDCILPEDQLLVYTVDKNGNRKEEKSEDEDTLDVPMAVLVNGNSASASEIFTAAMKDYERAVIVGENTYGKGIVQIVVPLSDGSALKMTTSEYYSPNGVTIHEVGVSPDVEIEPESGEEDVQLNAAIEALEGTNE